MTKRRTRKQKEKAKHQFSISWEPTYKSSNFKPSVKGQFKKPSSLKVKGRLSSKNAKKLAKAGNLASIKRDIVKSLIITSFILALEIMLYLAWQA